MWLSFENIFKHKKQSIKITMGNREVKLNRDRLGVFLIKNLITRKSIFLCQESG